MLVIEGAGQKVFKQLIDFMDEGIPLSTNVNIDKETIEGYFRTGKRDYTVFKFKRVKDKYKLDFLEHVQHPGDCAYHLQEGNWNYLKI